MTTILEDETRRLAEDLKNENAEAAISVACLLQVTRTMLQQFGADQGVSVQPLLDLQRLMVLNWISARGLSVFEVTSALESIQQAGETLAYLTGLPV